MTRMSRSSCGSSWRASVLASAVLVGMVYGTSSATALPNPPFLNGGSVPPDVVTAAVEEGVTAFALLREAPAVQACVVTLMKRLTTANARADAAAADAAESLYNACLSAAFAAARAYQPAGTPPACLDRQAVGGVLYSYLDLTLAHLFCDGPDVVHGLFHVPPDRSALRRATAVARIAGRFAVRHAKCSLAYAHAVFEADTDSAEIEAAKESYDRCYVALRFKAQQQLLRLDAASSGPPCLSGSSLLDEEVGLQARTAAVAFCEP